MSRRKQARPMKRVMEDEEEEQEVPETKCVRLDQPSTSSTPIASPIVPTSSLTISKSLAPAPSALTLLENSLKKFEPPRSSVPVVSSSGNLGALYSCIGKISSTVPSSESDGVTAILKCLQCGSGFPVMEQLVKHMQDTKHFSNLPKPYSNMIQMDRQKLFNVKMQSKAETVQLACLKCGEIPTNMDQHLRDVHDIKKKSEWLRNVQVISSLPPVALQSPQIKQLISLINTVAKQ